jgi:hypothetical protein
METKFPRAMRRRQRSMQQIPLLGVETMKFKPLQPGFSIFLGLSTSEEKKHEAQEAQFIPIFYPKLPT